ncbi:MAG TPA: glycosyltransferase family 2 protein [Tahibacter sp.]|uniref:glycosyltransferase family 2 protein n=1 Tax=Tahibacter sp. TaxID=2056211 RepID=UPI002BDBF580|nr:glycosyltransferase family 2 protein [Tahibacter sp.]HSX58673.1 glycosyltransferase family 2 protein [Tahibacter sp.]
MTTPSLTSVVVVTADSGPGIVDAMRRVLGSDVPVELLVSDNASTDGSIERVAAAFDGDARVRILHNGKNLGFGAGVNRAAALARGDGLLVLNPDCLVEPDTIARLRAHAATIANLGVLGVRILHPDRSDEAASLRRDPTLRRSLATLSGLSGAREGVDLPLDARTRGEDQPAEAVSGALMFLPRTAFDAVGGFDEGYFLHCEDLDLCRRLRDAGYGVRYAGSIAVVHGKGGSSRHRPVFVAWHKHRGMWRWFRRFDPAARNPLLRGIVFVGLWSRFAVLAPLLLWRRWRRAG